MHPYYGNTLMKIPEQQHSKCYKLYPILHVHTKKNTCSILYYIHHHNCFAIFSLPYHTKNLIFFLIKKNKKKNNENV